MHFQIRGATHVHPLMETDGVIPFPNYLLLHPLRSPSIDVWGITTSEMVRLPRSPNQIVFSFVVKHPASLSLIAPSDICNSSLPSSYSSLGLFFKALLDPGFIRGDGEWLLQLQILEATPTIQHQAIFPYSGAFVPYIDIFFLQLFGDVCYKNCLSMRKESKKTLTIQVAISFDKVFLLKRARWWSLCAT